MGLTEKLTAIADVVRDKTGGDQPLTLDDIKEQIAGLSLEPEKPYIDSSLLDVKYFCAYGQNLELLFHPDLAIFQAEDLDSFFRWTPIMDIPTGKLSFPFAKKAKYMFADVTSSNIFEYEADLSGLEVELPCVEDVTQMFVKSTLGVLPVLHLGESCRIAQRMFYHCPYLREVDLHTAKGIEDFSEMFTYNSRLHTVSVDMRSATSYRYMFDSCGSLVDLSIEALKIRDDNFRLDSCTQLSVESLVGVLEALESNVGEETTYTVVLGSENLAKLTDAQKQIAIDKNLALA